MLIRIIRRIVFKLPFCQHVYSSVQRWRALREHQRDMKTLQTHGRDLLRLVHEKCHGRIPYFIDFGTLLGCIRENSFLKHDDDIDIGLMPSANLADLIKAFEGTELKYFGGYVYAGKVMEIGYKFKKMRVDFFLYVTDGEFSYWDSYYDAPGVKYQNNETGCHRSARPLIKGIETIDFNGVAVDVPTNSEELLQAHYGEGWKKPDLSWHEADSSGKYGCKLMPGTCRFSVPKEELLAILEGCKR